MNIYRQLMYVLLLGLVGYIVFVIYAVIYREILNFLVPNQVVFIFWTEGILVGVVFSATELLNTSQSKATGFLRRVIYSSIAMLLALFLTVLIKIQLNWEGGQLTDEKYLITNGVVLLIFIIEILIIRYVKS